MNTIFKNLLNKLSLDAFFISKYENIGYVTGFWGSFAYVIITQKKIILISDERYSGSANILCKRKNIEYREITKKKGFLKDLLEEENIKTIGFEENEMSVSRYFSMRKNLGNAFKLKKTKCIIEKIREQKTEEEEKILQKAAKIADKALKKTIEHFKTGITEKELAWILEKYSRENFGAEGLSFESIVAFGENSAIPHHHPTDKKLEENMPILIDFGIKYKKYCSDMTRCFFFGTPTKKWQETYNLVLKAQKEAIYEIKIKNPLSSPEEKAREIFGKKSKYFIHSFGHGVGIEIHESPSLSSKTTEKFIKNMVVTAEPGLYYSKEFGIRIEDMGIVKEKGFKSFSKFPK